MEVKHLKHKMFIFFIIRHLVDRLGITKLCLYYELVQPIHLQQKSRQQRCYSTCCSFQVAKYQIVPNPVVVFFKLAEVGTFLQIYNGAPTLASSFDFLLQFFSAAKIQYTDVDVDFGLHFYSLYCVFCRKTCRKWRWKCNTETLLDDDFMMSSPLSANQLSTTYRQFFYCHHLLCLIC